MFEDFLPRRWLFGLAFVAVVSTASNARSETADPAWGAYAGRHLGNAEAAATCKGFRLNGARRDEITKIIQTAGLTKAFEAERSKQRSDREHAIREDSKICDAMWGAYGPKGLVSKKYLLRAGTADEANTPAFERGIEMGLDPRQMDQFQWAVNAVSAAAILSSCKGYELTPIADGFVSTVKESLDPKSIMLMAESIEKSFGKIGGPGFCKKILADYGPEGETPIMMKSRR